MLKRRRSTLINWSTYLAVFLLCVALYMSIRGRRKGANRYKPPDYKCVTVHSSVVNRNKPKVVSLWTHFKGDPKWLDVVGSNTLLSAHQVTTDDGLKCNFTIDRGQSVLSADAFIFHAGDISFHHLPNYRCAWQRWVFFNYEPPIDNKAMQQDDYWDMANLARFNMTMSYTINADVRFSFGRIIPWQDILFDSNLEQELNDRIEASVTLFYQKKSQAIWWPKKCSPSGGRDELAKKLMDHGIKVDIIGKCFKGKIKEEEMSMTIFENYRFYFAFDDALCDDYLKEAFTALKLNKRWGVIPVVFSGANLKRQLPEGSYIDASDPSKFDQVVALMKKLSSNDAPAGEVASFFAWQRSYKLADENVHKTDLLQTLCRKLWKMDIDNEPPAWYTSKELRSQLGKCQQPNERKNFRMFM